jgi:aminoglycoside phosphotransferase (APT) family kinase protein
VIGHGDLGPWNIIAREGLPVGFIDWDYAGPIDPTTELAYVGWLNAQLHDDALAELLELPDANGRARQLGLLLDGYGLARRERVGFVDRMVEHAVHTASDQALAHGVSHDSTSALGEGGFPVLWGVAWKVRSASWMLRNRGLLEAAI